MSLVVSAYSNSFTVISKCFFDHPERFDPRTEIAYLISNLQLDAGYERMPTACKNGRDFAS
jgi:hypothetical protein